MLNYRPITPADDAAVARIIRTNLEKMHLNIPGTVYFDPQLDHLSSFYTAPGTNRAYFVALDDAGQVVGGVGVGEFEGFPACGEMQKLYLSDAAKGKGWGKALVLLAEDWAKQAGYQQLYLETHSNLTTAMGLYAKLGFHEIPRPDGVMHTTMDHFFLKQLI